VVVVTGGNADERYADEDGRNGLCVHDCTSGKSMA
jgi:hypothetical protein